ncbi:hypothetical protein N7520_000477 [Penicillium odoratum]|uniref:uncharacterized protein n=1 Tax=Penicillium odoratum TaxID=1167516 RepID=UPI002548A315|nr:uncharacterized protein N7520_000477 [Penicillium odoratum]KAJ5777231.1 hypothetical protein N7520_000477 [Penicillium odoratum]
MTLPRRRANPVTKNLFHARKAHFEVLPWFETHRCLAPAIPTPIRCWGRGAYKPNTSNIEAELAAAYDPALDVYQENEDTGSKNKSRHVLDPIIGEEDWDTAIETLRGPARGRQKREKGKQAAGLSEETTERWKNKFAFADADGEPRPHDLRWSKKGEEREWD